MANNSLLYLDHNSAEPYFRVSRSLPQVFVPLSQNITRYKAEACSPNLDCAFMQETLEIGIKCHLFPADVLLPGFLQLVPQRVLVTRGSQAHLLTLENGLLIGKKIHTLHPVISPLKRG